MIMIENPGYSRTKAVSGTLPGHK